MRKVHTVVSDNIGELYSLKEGLWNLFFPWLFQIMGKIRVNK